ncbi:MAG TPA: Rieske 2Fe-2S domain-containing protein, partial [Steroidobacteraceae bacterium]|nr:Rieske 2Fe-2S domain-containing protein [Steroidobacteraceae bacterium]
YYDICGQKDESFAALVRELIERLIADASQPHLDPDAIALGLIGALEMIWQEFAFRTERDIDRAAAKRRCMAYLRSVFPGQFRAAGAGRRVGIAAARATRVPGWIYADDAIHALERAALFEPAWTAVGHESDIPRGGDFLTQDTGVERVLVVRGASGAVHALRNSCPESPHALVARRSGRFEDGIRCKLHGLEFSLEGRGAPGSAAADLTILDASVASGLIFARPRSGEGTASPRLGFEREPPAGLTSLGPPLELRVAADWKTVVERWLEDAPHPAPGAAQECILWRADPLGGSAWSARRYLSLVDCLPDAIWQRQFMMPNQLVELRPDGLSVTQALPAGPGRCLVRRLDYTALSPDDGARAVLYLARRLAPHARRMILETAESVQRGMIDFGYEIAAGGAGAPAVGWFRSRLAARIPELNFA